MYKAALALFFALVGSQAFAVSECTGKVVQVYAGENNAWIITDSTPSGVISQTNGDFKNIYAAALVALNADKSVTIRFAGDGVVCGPGGARGDVVGMFIRK